MGNYDPLDLIGGEPPAPAAPLAQGEGDDLPAKFERNTRRALDASAEILAIRPNPHSEHYGAELRAVAAASAAQISAQLKSDELALKTQRNKEAVMEEILRRIAEAEERLVP